MLLLLPVTNVCLQSKHTQWQYLWLRVSTCTPIPCSKRLWIIDMVALRYSLLIYYWGGGLRQLREVWVKNASNKQRMEYQPFNAAQDAIVR